MGAGGGDGGRKSPDPCPRAFGSSPPSLETEVVNGPNS
jgi:hypothetical protein